MLDATYGQQDRGMAVDAQGTDEEGLKRRARQDATRRCGHASQRGAR